MNGSMVIGSMAYNLLINGVYWGYNPFTNLLLTSWDIQVVGKLPWKSMGRKDSQSDLLEQRLGQTSGVLILFSKIFWES